MVIEVEGLEDIYEEAEDQVFEDGLPGTEEKEKVILLRKKNDELRS